MSKINTEPMSGMRDFLPLDVLRRDYVIDTIKRIYQRYGFEPLETPTIERLSTLWASMAKRATSSSSASSSGARSWTRPSRTRRQKTPWPTAVCATI